MTAIPPMTRGVSSGTQVLSRTSSTLLSVLPVQMALMALTVRTVRPVRPVLTAQMALTVPPVLTVRTVLKVRKVPQAPPVLTALTVLMVSMELPVLMAPMVLTELMVRAYPLVVRLVRCLPRSTAQTTTPSGWPSLVAAVAVSPKLRLMVTSTHDRVQAGRP